MLVQTSYGTLEGVEDRGAFSFRGIPFAKPPVGPLRFKPPQPPDRWAGVRDATRFGHRAPQLGFSMETVVPSFTTRGDMDEDCLYLNVWTPSFEGSHRPVLVWFHGGGFHEGSGSETWYDGARLAIRSDVVVVTVNYRLGILGFLYLGGLEGGLDVAVPNAALLDQAAALGWVRDNIGVFGGDPANVTIFGQSAGGMSVSALMALPAAKGLFQRAISQSCVSHEVFGLFAHTADADTVARSLLSELDIPPTEIRRLVDVSVGDLLRVQQTVMVSRRISGGQVFRPVVDGKILPTAPIEAIRAGHADVPYMVGSTRDEQNLGRYRAKQGRDFVSLVRGSAPERAATAGPGEPSGGGSSSARNAELIEVYRRARERRGESTARSDLEAAIGTDRSVRIPGIRFAEAHAARPAGTYMYLFSWRSPNPELGACHTIEIPFIFGCLDLPGIETFAGRGPEAAALSESIQDAWVSFARTGNPNHAGIPFWPNYDADRRATMVFDAPCRVEDDPLGEERRAWDGLI